MNTPVFVFAHGAGAPSGHPWMRRWAERLKAIGAVSLFDYPYMKERRRRPDPLPRLIEAHREALLQARREYTGPAILIGKSLGARVGCYVALEEAVSAVVCLGYPLCGGGDRERLRAEVLRKLETPILFVQGTRDRLCPLDLLEAVRHTMKTENELYVVEGGDHSLLVTKGQLAAAGKTQHDIDDQILHRIRDFVAPRILSRN
jgi:predicted alpha/beta-hydrolase family hydrolase